MRKEKGVGRFDPMRDAGLECGMRESAMQDAELHKKN